MADELRVWIYALADPETGEHHYVGLTQEPEARLQGHLNESRYSRRRTTPPRLTWMRSLADRGLTPEIILLESAPREKGREIEHAWIKECRLQGCPLTNASNPWRVPLPVTALPSQFVTESLT